MEIKMYAVLREVVGGKSVTLAHTEAQTMQQILQELFEMFPTLKTKLLLKDGSMHSAFHFLVNGRDARYLDGLDTLIQPTDDVRVFPPVGGG